PVYYNIAQNPYYADAVAKANIDGVSFQWYPTGLVANYEVKGNFLPNVDYYPIPFDTIAAFRNKTKMVYEFDAADLLQSNLYPVMARSFRQAGFQWATQFAYDPTALAHANTEYQTHYLNLLYTPSKAVSMLIASRAFHKLPRLKSYGTYPVDSSFDVFRVSYKNSLSEMNAAEEFYYSNSTNTQPVAVSKLKHIAGVGNSSLVRYEGSGAYFLDKIAEGVWRLEVYPDAIHIRDPFERASPRKEVTRLHWQSNPMQISLPDLPAGFSIKALNEGNNFSSSVSANSFNVYPGTYLISASNKTSVNTTGVIGLNEFGAIKTASPAEMLVRHEPLPEISAGKAFTIRAKIAGLDTGRAMLQISKPGNWRSTRRIPMVRTSGAEYAAEIPADFVAAGQINYRIILQKGKEFAVFPGNHKEDPFAWDNFNYDVWQTFVVAPNAKLEVFNPTSDKEIWFYPDPYKRGFQNGYTTATESKQLVLQLATTGFTDYNAIGFIHYMGNKLQGRISDLNAFDKLVVRARTTQPQPVKAKIILTDKDGFAFSSIITLNSNFQNIEIPLNKLAPDSLLLLPNAYPGFLPVWFKASGSSSFKLSEIEKIQMVIGKEWNDPALGKPYNMEIGPIWLQ
ncbi:MAG TPA: membrane or secreted protein, partial [Flavisolibacter sp.]|nr:membrane or secreted protein [Flavisolibacter sp.]